jgi:hypothetical protein
MAFDSFHLSATVGSTGTFELNPGWNFSEELVVNRQQNRTISGEYNSYQLQGDFFRYTIPMTFVASETRDFIHTWWRDQTDVVLTLNLSSNPESLLCRIANVIEPLGARTPGVFDRYDGMLRLHSIRASTTPVSNRFPFILDNSSLGLLDQTYNFLDGTLPKSSTEGKGKGAPFLLDEPTWGLLDQTYNIVI